MIYRPEQDGTRPMKLQDENGPIGYVPAPTGDSTSGFQLAKPKYDPMLAPPPTLNSDSPTTGAPAGGAPSSNPATGTPSSTPPSSVTWGGTTALGAGNMANTLAAGASGPSAPTNTVVAPPAGGVATNPMLAPPMLAPPMAAANPNALTGNEAPYAVGTGNGTPYAVGTGNSAETNDLMSQITKAISGRLSSSGGPAIAPGSGSTALSGRLESEAMRQLDQPTVYDDALYKSASDMMKRGVNENYDLADTQLAGELADRGINYSTIAGGRIMDLKRSRAAALSDADTNTLRERAAAMASGRSAAFNNARGISGDQYDMQRGARDEARYERGYGDDRLSGILSSARGVLGDRANIEAGQRQEQRGERGYVDDTLYRARQEQRGERGYVDDIRNRARDEAMQTAQLEAGYGDRNDAAYQDFLNQVYGYGSDTSGSSLLGRAAGNYADAAGGYGQQAGGEEDDLASLAQWALQYLNGGKRAA